MDQEHEESELSERGGEKEMSFLDHLEELRWRIIYALIGVVVGALAVWIFIDLLMEERYIMLGITEVP